LHCGEKLAGERVPCDGEVIDGLAAIDESMLTGESVLVPKGVGAAVAGGCIVFEGPLTIKASATGAESTLAGGAHGSVATGVLLYCHDCMFVL
jgi:P-type E1-E2 ATPase